MKALEEAFDLFKDLEVGTQLVALNGCDSELVAVVSNYGVNLFQSHGSQYAQSLFLPEECFEQLIKVLQGKIDNGS